MQPNEKITGYYDLDDLTGQALREADAIDTVTALDALFEGSDSTVVPKDFGHNLPQRMVELTSGNGRVDGTSFQGSDPYDAFEHNGITFESRIYRISSGEITKEHVDHGFVTKTVYLIGLVPQGQTKLSVHNFKFGVVRNESGEQTFFSIISDAEGGTPNVAELSPENETLIVEELKKAAAATSQSELGS